MKFIEPIGRVVDMPHYISYGETDAMGVLYYAEYLHICERARNFLGRETGFLYADMEKMNLFLPVREAEVRYRSSVRYDDLIYVRVGVSEWKRASVRFSYRIYDATKTKLVAEAMTMHACVSKEAKVTPFPASFKDKFFL